MVSMVAAWTLGGFTSSATDPMWFEGWAIDGEQRA
jgi:hypothetical protein